jgi:hypothetical protein
MCFNCLQPGHVAVDCRSEAWCLRCLHVGHQARTHKWQRSLASADVPTLPPRSRRPTSSVVVLNPGAGDIFLATRGRSHFSSAGTVPPASSAASTPTGSSSWYSMLSPPPPPLGPEPVGSLSRRPRFETCIIPRTPAMNAAEAQLSNTMLAMVGGSQPSISPSQVREHLQWHFGLADEAFQVRRSFPDDFLVSFSDGKDLARMLHTKLVAEGGFSLFFRCWTRQARACFSPIYFKVLLSITRVPAHAWSVETAQPIVGLSCLIVEVSLRSLNGEDLSRYMAVAWCLHPDLIPTEVGCVIPEPEVPSVEREPPLFLLASEIIHSKKDALQFHAFIHTIEIHDFTSLNSSDDDSGMASSDSEADNNPGHDYASGSLQPWPKVYRCVSESSYDEPWPSLPMTGGGAMWPESEMGTSVSGWWAQRAGTTIWLRHGLHVRLHGRRLRRSSHARPSVSKEQSDHVIGDRPTSMATVAMPLQEAKSGRSALDDATTNPRVSGFAGNKCENSSGSMSSPPASCRAASNWFQDMGQWSSCLYLGRVTRHMSGTLCPWR